MALGEFYNHKKTVNKKRVERGGHTKKTEHRKNIAFKTTSPNERKATRTTWQEPRQRHGKDANTLTPENACVCIHANTLAVCNIGFHGRAEMSAPLI